MFTVRYGLNFRRGGKIANSDCKIRHVCSSACPHETTRLPPDGFSWNLISEYFFENLPRKLKFQYLGADKSLARPGRKQAQTHVRDARDFNNIETQAVIKFFFPARQGAILTETLACFLSGRAKDLSGPLYNFSTLTASIKPIPKHVEVATRNHCFLQLWQCWKLRYS